MYRRSTIFVLSHLGYSACVARLLEKAFVCHVSSLVSSPSPLPPIASEYDDATRTSIFFVLVFALGFHASLPLYLS